MAGFRGLGIRGRVCRAAVWTACVLGAIAADHATAQSYKVDKPKLTQVEMQQALSKVAGILRQTTDPPAADLKTLDDYFAGFYFPMITSADPAQLGKLGDLRKALFVRFINSAKSQGGRDYLVNVALKNAQQQSIGNYHPAVRYNAVLILGQLDQAAAADQPPKPIPAATKSLIVLMQRDEVGSVPITQAVKIAALVGLERHARLGVADPQDAQNVTNVALAVANRKDPPEEISADVNNWMRALAAQVLISQHAASVTAPVNDVLVNLIGGAELGLDDRCRIAELLVPTMYGGAQGVDSEGMALAIGKLAKAVLAEERKKAQEYQDEMVGDNSFVPGGGGRGGFGGGRGGYDGGGGRGGYGGGRGGFGGGMMGEFAEDTGPHYERRRLVDRLAAVQTATAAVVGGGSDELKQRVTELAELLKSAVTTAADEDTTELALADLVVELAGDVNGIVNGWNAGEAPAAAEDADDDEFADAN
jgi:hypothetical protein